MTHTDPEGGRVIVNRGRRIGVGAGDRPRMLANLLPTQRSVWVKEALTRCEVEGHVTRIKLIKRQMFGRANFDLLRRRILLAS